MRKICLVVLALVAIYALAAPITTGHGGNPPVSTEESGATPATVVGQQIERVGNVEALDAVSVDPKHYYKVDVENDEVRVIRFHLGPKEISPMHSHPPNVLVASTDGHIKVTGKDGNVRDITRKAGGVTYRPAETHTVENLDDKDYESVVVELKHASAASTESKSK
jgi:quercetin dioxygenase-like cupin family protein